MIMVDEEVNGGAISPPRGCFVARPSPTARSLMTRFLLGYGPVFLARLCPQRMAPRPQGGSKVPDAAGTISLHLPVSALDAIVAAMWVTHGSSTMILSEFPHEQLPHFVVLGR
jgi:hypothetical protein